MNTPLRQPSSKFCQYGPKRYDLMVPIQYTFLSSISPLHLQEPHISPGRARLAPHTPVGSAPRIVSEIDTLTLTIRNVKDCTPQTLGEELGLPVTPFSLSNSQWLFRSHSCLTISLIELPGQIDNHYIMKDGLLLSLCCGGCPLSLQIFAKEPLIGTPSIFTDGGKRGAAAAI